MNRTGAYEDLLEQLRAELDSDAQLSSLDVEELTSAQSSLVRAGAEALVLRMRQRGEAGEVEALGDPGALVQRLLDDTIGLGPLEPLLRDESVEDIAINHPLRVFVHRSTGKQLTDVSFSDDEEVRSLALRALARSGRRLDAGSPLVDATLPGNVRLHAVIPPITNHVVVTIRRHTLARQTWEEVRDLGVFVPPSQVERGRGEEPAHESFAMPADPHRFLELAREARLDILFSGPTGSGKTMMLRALASGLSSTHERVVTIEETYELGLEEVLSDCVAMQTREKNVESKGAVEAQELCRNVLRMRPTRIIVGEVRGAEAYAMLHAIATGHEGSMGTIHAATPVEALDKLLLFTRMDEETKGMSDAVLNRLIGSTIDLVVQMQRDVFTGKRFVSSIYEVIDSEEGVVRGHELFAMEGGRLVPTAVVPACLDRLAAAARGVEARAVEAR